MSERTISNSHDDSEREASAQAHPSMTTEGVSSLRDRLEAAETDRDKYLEMLRRTTADFENYRKRLQRELAEESRYVHSDLARELLPVYDNLQQALDAATKTGDMDSLVVGSSRVDLQACKLEYSIVSPK